MPLDHRTAFSGSRDGMTLRQKQALFTVMADLTGWWVHGDCLGSDAQSHTIARGIIWLRIEIHPSTATAWRAWCLNADKVLPPKAPLDRNIEMVNTTHRLIAAPSGDERTHARSGTWYTVRRARERKRWITLIFPDGAIKEERAS